MGPIWMIPAIDSQPFLGLSPPLVSFLPVSFLHTDPMGVTRWTHPWTIHYCRYMGPPEGLLFCVFFLGQEMMWKNVKKRCFGAFFFLKSVDSFWWVLLLWGFCWMFLKQRQALFWMARILRLIQRDDLRQIYNLLGGFYIHRPKFRNTWHYPSELRINGFRG